jgi:site-specific DNA recombinase
VTSQPAAATKHAVLYLRVSTPRQMHTGADVDAEGNSIATQREACHAKAHNLGVGVLAEFVEPGNSAQSIEKRPVFKQLLAYLEDHRSEVTYVIVYMRSRAFRNSVDAAITKRALGMFGIRIVSCKEDFGIGPVADAMETVSDAFNELQVRQSGEDIRQKLRHKALNGGTISRAKLGYLNIRAEHEGRLFNSIGLDDKRAPLVLQAFELYATGEYSVDRLEAVMADAGFTTRPSSRHPQEKPVCDSRLHRMLNDPYYAGWVTVDGQLIKGRHAAIVSQDLFDQVQEVLAARSKGGNRDRLLQHYLKGMLCCDRCHKLGRTSRMIYTEAKGRNGQYYGYFFCRARQEKQCDLPHLASWQVEEAIERHYASLRVPDDFAQAVREQVEAAMADQQQLTNELHTKLAAQLAKLEAREQRLIDLAADGLLSRPKIVERSNAIQVERVRIAAQLADTSAELAVGVERLSRCLELVSDPVSLYANAPDETRRQLNATFYQRFYLDDVPTAVASDERKPPFDEIRRASWVYGRYKAITVGQVVPARQARTDQVSPESTGGGTEANRRSSLATGTPASDETLTLADIFSVSGSSKRVVVELRGFEPLTPSMRTRCATGLRYSPRTGSQRSKHWRCSAPGFPVL